jgi:hypothetical protein
MKLFCSRIQAIWGVDLSYLWVGSFPLLQSMLALASSYLWGQLKSCLCEATGSAPSPPSTWINMARSVSSPTLYCLKVYFYSGMNQLLISSCILELLHLQKNYRQLVLACPMCIYSACNWFCMCMCWINSMDFGKGLYGNKGPTSQRRVWAQFP